MSADTKRPAAIIAEYNPLHNGHLFHMATTAEKLRPEHIIIIMSGAFTQRGTPAILDKYIRAAHAVQAGADIVLELPAVFALSNAEHFAKGAVKLLSALCPFGGYLSFGSECGSIPLLSDCAALMLDEPKEVSAAVKHNLKSMPFPMARCEAYRSYAQGKDIALPDIQSPNNMLALEYIKAIIATKSPLMPFTIRREGAYHGLDIGERYISSRAARVAISEGDTTRLRGKVPDFVLDDLIPLKHKLNSAIVLDRLQSMDAFELAKLYDIGEGLENRIKRYADTASSYDEFLQNVMTKRYTASRLKRIFAYALLGITYELHDYAKQAAPYYNVLAVKDSKTHLLSEFSKRGDLYVSEKQLACSGNLLAELDARASRIWRVLTEQKSETGMIVIK